MRRIRLGYRQRGELAVQLRGLLLAAALVAVLLAIDAQIRPMIQSMAAYQAKVFATRAINDSIAEQLSREDIQYDHLVRVSFDPSGQVSAVQTDMVRLNRLKADLTGAASDRVAELERQEIGIPLGTLVGGQFFSGRGPVVEFKVVPAGFVQSELIHRFDSAGINQTRHQIVMQLDVSIIALLPGYVTTTEVST
ncbi:MAG: sporulation protein YunB, partial [Oscillospiraceae bacterium]